MPRTASATRTSTRSQARLRVAAVGRIALAIALVLGCRPALAQDRNADPELEALIPDAALDNPEGWAQSGPQPAPDAPADPFDAAAPLADDGGFRLPWPDQSFELPALADLPPDPGALPEPAAGEVEQLAQLPQGEADRVSSRLTLVFPAGTRFPEREAFEDRFRELSTIEALSGDAADSAAQLAVRARTDADLLRRLLRIYGYYDAEVTQALGGAYSDPAGPAEGQGAAPTGAVRFDIVPGNRYRFGAIDLGRIDEARADAAPLRDAFGIKGGDPLSSDRIVTARADLDTALGERGFPFARIADPDLLVDHAREEGDLTMPVTPGGKYNIAGVTSGLPRFLPSKHLQTIARFDPGDLYKRSEVEDLRRAIVATGLVSAVTVTEREVRAPAGDTPGEVNLDIGLTPAPLRTIAGQVGYDSAEGFRLEGSWEHRNLFPPEGALRLRGVAGTREQLAGATFRRNNFKGRDQVLTLDLYANRVDRDAYSARTVSFSAGFEKLTTLLFQKPWVWSAGLEVVATGEREGDVGGVRSPRRTYYIAALPLRAAFDGSDDLLDPTRGFRAALRVSPEISRQGGGNATYVRIQADASAYLPVGGRVVVAARARVGSIPGAAITAIAPSRRFYAGGGGSVRGYGYQQIGPRNALGDPSGGRSLSEFSLEARVKTGLFGDALSVVPFIDAGAVDEEATPRLRDIRFGAGIGLRYQTGFGPIRIDIGTPLNRRPGDSRIAVYVALGQAF